MSLKGFNAHKLMAFMGHTDIKSSLHYVHLNVDVYVMVWGLVLSEKMIKVMGIWLRRTDLNRRPSGYEPDELPLLYSAISIILDLKSGWGKRIRTSE